MTQATVTTIAVPTFHRPADLRALLPMLHEQIAEAAASLAQHEFRVDVLVVDNDPDGSGQRTVVELDLPRTRAVVEGTPGIAAVRNRAMTESPGSDLLVFIDDDERPQQNWLSSLLRTWLDTRAALVSGRVVPEYDGELDPWIAAGGFFVRRSMKTGTPLELAAAGNLLLDLRQVRALGVAFDRRFGLSGGEDTLFSRELSRRGGTMVWCNESVAVDKVPSARMTRRWVLTRRCSHGNTIALIDIDLAEGPVARIMTRLTLVATGGLRMASGGARFAAGLVLRSRRQQALGLRTAYRGVGIVSGALGWSYQEYSRSGRKWVRA